MDRIRRTRLAACALLTALLALPLPGYPARRSTIPVYPARPAAVHPHDATAFTEGLYYEGGRLYESTGIPGQSDIREVNLDTGAVLRRAKLDPSLFGEGIVRAGGRIVSLTWQTGVGFLWDPRTFAKTGSFRYPGEGWALTLAPSGKIAMSDGTPDIRLLDATTLKRTGTIHVTADGVGVERLNEIEWVGSRLLANVWHTNRIAVIDPKTGHVAAWIDCARLAAQNRGEDPEGVLNGIAWDAKGRRLFVTGKLWPRLYEVHVPELGL